MCLSIFRQSISQGLGFICREREGGGLYVVEADLFKYRGILRAVLLWLLTESAFETPCRGIFNFA